MSLVELEDLSLERRHDSVAKAIVVKEDFLMRVRLYDHERGGHRHGVVEKFRV
jgi:hypothetical protein